MARLGDVCEIINGYAFRSEKYSDNGIRIIRISNVQKGYIEDNLPVFYPSNDNNALKYQLIEGDLLISLTGNVGRVGVFERKFMPAALNQRVACIRIKDNNLLCKSFLFYFLNSDFFEEQCILSSKGVAQKNLSTEWLKEYVIPLPSLNEQRKIAAVLDKVSDLIAKRRQQLDKLDTLMKARFVEMFGDPISNPYGYRQAKLADVADYFNGLTYKPENVSDEGIIVLRSSNIQSCQLDFADTVRVSCKVKDRFMVQENDILMCSRNGSARLVGKVALIKNQQEPMSFGAFMMIIRSRYYSYLMTYFQMDAFRQQIKTGATTTINQITGKMLDDVTIPLPPMMLVEQFASFIEQTNKSKLSIQKSCEKLETLKKSLMQQYFG